jgi:hypothetical protein
MAEVKGRESEPKEASTRTRLMRSKSLYECALKEKEEGRLQMQMLAGWVVAKQRWAVSRSTDCPSTMMKRKKRRWSPFEVVERVPG